jgi:hypothetical protein
MLAMPKIAVCIPSRGLVFSKLMESVVNNIKDYDFSLHMAHNISIPNCMNFPVEEALEDKDVTHIWLVEEDHIFPKDTLKRMLEMNEPVVSTAYSDRRNQINLVLQNPDGEVLYTGIGCMLVKREVFDKLEKPYFRCAMYEIQKNNGFTKLVLRENIKHNYYGSHDVYFCCSLRNAGYKINLLPNAKIGHMMVVEKGEDMKNDGCHLITTRYLEE